MKVSYYPKEFNNKHKCSLILGSFETIHNGHLELIKKAKEVNSRIAIMIFEDPSQLPGANKINFTDLETRLQQLANLQVDQVTVVKFNNDIRLQSGKDFIKSLINIFNAKHLIMGKDFACGKGREYKAKDIQNDFKNTDVMEHSKVNNNKISTSLLKEFLHLGEVDLIKKLSPYAYSMNVNVKSDGSVDLSNYPKLHSGIYATTIVVNDILYWSYLHISQEKKAKLIVPDLQLKNTPYKGQLSFYKLIRIIVSSKEDSIKDSDSQKVAFYLKNNI